MAAVCLLVSCSEGVKVQELEGSWGPRLNSIGKDNISSEYWLLDSRASCCVINRDGPLDMLGLIGAAVVGSLMYGVGICWRQGLELHYQQEEAEAGMDDENKC